MLRGPSPREIDVVCVRASDGTEELIGRGVAYPWLQFDPTGRRMLLSTTQEDGGDIRTLYQIVDFAMCSKRALIGLKATSGSTFRMTDGGRLLTIGSSSAMVAYDLDRGTIHAAQRRPFYCNEPMRGHAVGFFAYGDDPNDEELFWLEIR